MKKLMITAAVAAINTLGVLAEPYQIPWEINNGTEVELANVGPTQWVCLEALVGTQRTWIKAHLNPWGLATVKCVDGQLARSAQYRDEFVTTENRCMRSNGYWCIPVSFTHRLPGTFLPHYTITCLLTCTVVTNQQGQKHLRVVKVNGATSSIWVDSKTQESTTLRWVDERNYVY